MTMQSIELGRRCDFVKLPSPRSHVIAGRRTSDAALAAGAQPAASASAQTSSCVSRRVPCIETRSRAPNPACAKCVF
jgi:hypothetical protein